MFKHRGMSLVVIDYTGTVFEDASCDQEIAHVSDFVKTVDVDRIAKVLLVNPHRKTPKDSGISVEDKTDEVINYWLSITDILEWDREIGRPECVSESEWSDLVDEAAAEAESFARHERFERMAVR